MANEPAIYEYPLGKGDYLTAYSINPKINSEGLKRIVHDSLLSTKGKKTADLEKLSENVRLVGSVGNFSDLRIKASFEIVTPYTTRKLAEIAYGQPTPIKEHSVFFSIDRNNLDSAIEKFDIYVHNLVEIYLLRKAK